MCSNFCVAIRLVGSLRLIGSPGKQDQSQALWGSRGEDREGLKGVARTRLTAGPRSVQEKPRQKWWAGVEGGDYSLLCGLCHGLNLGSHLTFLGLVLIFNTGD